MHPENIFIFFGNEITDVQHRLCVAHSVTGHIYRRRMLRNKVSTRLNAHAVIL